MASLSGALDALVAGRLDDCIVGTVELGSVQDGADPGENCDVCLGAMDPGMALVVQEACMDAAIGDGHPCSPRAEVSDMAYGFVGSASVSGGVRQGEAPCGVTLQ